jgi:predicted ATPase
MDCPCVVLTGGPGGGKTALLRELRAEDPRACRWLLVPEAAPLLFQVGLDARRQDFQRAVVRLQTALEDACRGAARPGQVLLCHRGTLDALAYWLHRGWAEDEFFAFTATTRGQHLGRYAGVLHLVTAALGAEEHYRRWPDAHRPETAAQAAQIDRLCGRAWAGHPGYVRIDNAGDGWAGKARAARGRLDEVLARAGPGSEAP